MGQMENAATPNFQSAPRHTEDSEPPRILSLAAAGNQNNRCLAQKAIEAVPLKQPTTAGTAVGILVRTGDISRWGEKFFPKSDTKRCLQHRVMFFSWPTTSKDFFGHMGSKCLPEGRARAEQSQPFTGGG